MSSIMRHWLGPTRLPMLIIDHPDVVRQRHGFSARAAGIQGMMLFGRHYCYALNEDMSVNIDAVAQFLQRFSHERIFIFGFTFMLWAHWLQQPDVQALCRRYALQDSVLLHGAVEKLQAQAVSTAAFNARVNTVMGQVSTLYGMVEQTDCMSLVKRGIFIVLRGLMSILYLCPHYSLYHCARRAIQVFIACDELSATVY